MTLVRVPGTRRLGLRWTKTESVAEAERRWPLEWIYFSFVVAAWCFMPLVRRLIDYQAGAFSPVQISSVIPFVMLIPLAFICLRKERLARLTRSFRYVAAIWLATFTYGLLIALAVGNTGAAAFTFVEYVTPMLAGIWIAGQELSPAQCFRRLALILLPCAAVVAVYGVYQWIQPPPWDVMWVVGSEFLSAGEPVPFAMRVFSTLNSPGPAGDFFALAMLFTLPLLRLKSVWIWPLLCALGAALLLSLVREAWVGLLVGAVVYLALSPRRLKTAPLLGVCAIVIAFLVFSLPAFLGSGRDADLITSRISTLGDVGHDESALDREAQIQGALQTGLGNPVGAGLGMLGAASKIGASPQGNNIGAVLDSGYLTRLIELGWLGTLGYVLVVIGGPIALGSELFRAKSGATVEAKVVGAAAIAMCAALAWGDAADEAHLGLQGFFFWIALGLVSLAIRSAAPAATPMRGRFGRAVN